MEESHKKTLVSLTQDSLKIRQELIESGGECSLALDAMMLENEVMVADKVDRCVFIITQLEQDAELMSAHAEQFLVAKKSFDNARERLKAYIKNCMNQLNDKKLGGNMYQFSISNAKPKLIIDNESLVPEAYKTQTISYTIDKETLRTELGAGVDIPGCRLESSTALRFKPVGGKK